MESIGERSARRRRFRVVPTLARIIMDAIEFRQAYNTAVNAAENVEDIFVRTALLDILQLLAGLQAQIEELQLQDDC